MQSPFSRRATPDATTDQAVAPAIPHNSLREAAARSREELDRLVDLLSFLRTQRGVEPIRYGRVRYEGVLYLISKDSEPIDDAETLFRRTADDGGRSRFGSVGRPTWYGALDPFTAIAEAAYHALTDRDACASEQTLGMMYQLRVRGRFVDLHGRERAQPEIVADDYAATWALAREVRKMPAFSGVLYPSARSSGTCLAVFARQALRAAKFIDGVPMLRASPSLLKVKSPWSASWWKLHLDDLRRVAAAKAACA